MPREEGVRTAREAAGVFTSPESLQEAIDELLSSGFHGLSIFVDHLW